MNNSAERTEQVDDELSVIFREQVTARIVMEKQLGDTNIVICVMTYVRPNTGESNTSRAHRTVKQTAVMLTATDLDLPLFHLKPRATGLAGWVFSKLGSMGELKFEDSPEFTEACHVQAWNEEATRILFTEDIRQHFADNKKWNVRGEGTSLVLFHHDKVIDKASLNDFAKAALAILKMFQAGEKELDARPEIRRDTSSEDVLATAGQMDGLAGGMIGSMMLRQMQSIAVSPSELRTFVDSPTPRFIPPGMKRQIVGNIGALIPVGIVMTLIGLAFSIGLFLSADGLDRFFAIMPLILAIVGALLIYFTMSHTKKKSRCLSHGELVRGVVSRVEATSTSINNQRRYLATIDYKHNGSDQTTTCNIYGQSVQTANSLQKSNSEVNVLVDPEDPTHVVCTDLLMVFEV